MVALWPFMGLRVVMDIERIINHTGRKPPLHDVMDLLWTGIWQS